VILLAGEMEFDQPFLGALSGALQHGSRVLMSSRQRQALGIAFEGLRKQGSIGVLEQWTNSVTGRSSAISDASLRRIVGELQPIAVTGDKVQYQINRTETGWVVELINNDGVIKTPDQPAKVDSKAVARVRLKPVSRCSSSVEWRSGRTSQTPDQIEVTVGPGSSEFIEFRER
jgi:hypothetical protein